MTRSILSIVLVVVACSLLTASAGAVVKTIDYSQYYSSRGGYPNPRFLTLSYDDVQKLSPDGVEFKLDISGMWIIDIQGYAGAKKGKRKGKGSNSGRRVNFKTRRAKPQKSYPFLRVPFEHDMYKRARKLMKKSGMLPAKIGLTVDLFEPDIRRIFYNQVSITLVP